MSNEAKQFIDELATESREQLAEIRAYRTYKGNNPEYGKRAKMAIGVIGSYVRLRATMANEESNRLISIRMLGPKQLQAASGE